jgi:2'-hydroxyisoflavone reductase
VRLCEAGTYGVFNAIERMTWRALLEACVREVRPDARLVWVPSDWLLEQGVGEWMELPVWTGSQSSEHAGLHRVANARAVAAGLTFRPLEDTVQATLAEAATTDDAGLKPEREAALLADWASLASGA